jgi:hypothetical protein
MDTPRKYTVLRIVAIIIQVLAWIVLVGGVILTLVWFFNAQNMFAGIWVDGLNLIGLIFLVIGATNFIPLYFVSNVLLALCDIEQNTRANSTAIAQLVKLAQSAEAARLSSAAPKTAIPPAPSTPAPTTSTTATPPSTPKSS